MSEIFGDGSGKTVKSGPNSLRPLSEDEVETVARNYIEECVDFRDADLASLREKIDRYYRGKVDLPVPEGRSNVIVTAVRDGVKSVVPSLARIFTQTDEVAEFYSNEEFDQQICKDATAYCNNVFWTFGGYKALIEAATDSLKAKVGIIKVSLEKKTFVSHLSYDRAKVEATGAELDNVTEQSNDEIVQTNKVERKVWSFVPVPPEEFLIHHSATSIEDAVCCAHEREVSISELIQMGYTYDQLKDIPSSTSINVEDKERKRVFREKDEGRSPNVDPTARLIMFAEIFARIDADGDGIAELRKVCVAGDGRKLISNVPVNYAPYAEFQAEIAPHVFYPICLAEDLVQDQDAQTALLRSIIDNAALTNNPRTVVNERFVNLTDAKNGKIGAMIRVREMGQIEELATPFVAGQTLPVLQHLQDVSERRSGITKLSQGLDPDALQSTSRIAAQAAVAASDARIEMMARNIAETGVKNMFRCILKTAIYEVNTPQSIPSPPDGFRSVNPAIWHLYLSIKVKVGLGSGRIDEKKQVLTSILPIQQAMIEKMGPDNPMAGWLQARETMKTLLRLNGIHDYQTYFPYVPPEQIKQLADQQKQAAAENQKQIMQAQQAQSQAALEFVKVEAQKAQLKFQSELASLRQKSENDIQTLQQKSQNDIQKLQAQIAELSSRSRIEMSKVILQDDRERDKADMDFIIDSKKVDLEEEKVRVAEQKVEAPRNNGAILS